MTPICLIKAIGVAGLFMSPAAPCLAQISAPLDFEQVGDRPINAKDLAFDQEGTLWADAGELYRLVMGTGEWEEINPAAGFGGQLLVLSPDTLFLASTSSVARSVDAGETFFGVYDDGGALFGASTEGPNSGVILSGEFGGASGIAYSTDRGATFTSATFTVSTSTEPFLESAVEIPDGPAAGRLVAGVFGGVVVSEDAGRTWSPSSLFQDARFWVQRVEVGTEPGTSNRRLYLTLADAQLPNVQFYFSDDDGLTWTNVPGMVDAYLFVFVPETTGSLLAVERADAVDGEYIVVWRSIDGGQSWIGVGELPAEVDGGGISSRDMLIGPDGHVYVAVLRAGPEPEWVYRTTEPVFVASEPGVPELPETVFDLSVRPNPARGRAVVPFSVAASAHVQIAVFDLIGRNVTTLVDGRYEAGAYQAIFDGSRLASGMYLLKATVQLETGGASQTFTQRITLLK